MSSSRVATFSDPHEYAMAIRAGEGVQVLPTAKGDFQAELIQIDLRQLWMQRGRESLPRILSGRVKKNRVAIEFPTAMDQSGFRYDGVHVSPGKIVVDDDQFRHRITSTASRWGAMSLVPDYLAAMGRLLIGREVTCPPEARVIRPAPSIMTRLLVLHDEAARLAMDAPDTLQHPEVARSLEHSLINLMIRCLAEDTALQVSAARRRHSVIIKRFEEFLAANYDKPLYLAEICRATGASDGTLRACCHGHLGMGPMRYLWFRRMHLARCALFRADPAKTTVTIIATDHGFWELGRFSVEYHTLFGESPSASLRRAQDDRRAPPNRPLDAKFSDFAYPQP
jgi:AraC-like DNA-binding protein